jgi:hypothetical protein
MRQVRLFVIAAGCLVAGPLLVYRHFAGLPQFDELSKVAGTVGVETTTRTTRYAKHRHPVLVVSGSSTRYSYLDWFPRVEEIPRLLKDGDEVTLWIEPGRNWVWQIERGGEQLVSYQEIRDAVAANERFNLLIGSAVFLLGVAAAFMLYRSRRQ